jgi:hypothetical protein
MRLDEPQKEMRRRSVVEGETNEANLVAGASGQPRHGRKRPGRAASLMGTAQRTRSQKWRSPAKGSRSMRRGNLAKGSRTGRNRTS